MSMNSNSTSLNYQQAKKSDANLAAELEKAKQENIELQEENKLLRSKGIDLQLQVDNLLEELSKKEAEWCSKEENLMLEVDDVINYLCSTTTSSKRSCMFIVNTRKHPQARENTSD